MQRTSFGVQRSPPLPAALAGLRALFSVGAVTFLGALCAGAGLTGDAVHCESRRCGSGLLWCLWLTERWSRERW